LSGTPATGLLWVPKASVIAKEAGARLREFFAEGVETEYKGDVDIVTVADRTVEKLVRGRLAEAFPGHGVYGEEGTRERMEGEFRWYVDPLDGTTNFAHGFPQFCVSLGLEHRPGILQSGQDGTLVAGVIYDPMRDELFTSRAGQRRVAQRQADSGFAHIRNWPNRWWPRVFPAASAMTTRISTSTRNSRCDRTGCGGLVQPRWTWLMLPRAA
jgi:fructose-1,6-bisphosphatase/inositol monophosphatase family enzyme